MKKHRTQTRDKKYYWKTTNYKFSSTKAKTPKKMTVAIAAIQHIENNHTLRQRILSALTVSEA
jgi:hypothetical protein